MTNVGDTAGADWFGFGHGSEHHGIDAAGDTDLETATADPHKSSPEPQNRKRGYADAVSELLDTVGFKLAALVLTLGLYYLDFATDVLVVVGLFGHNAPSAGTAMNTTAAAPPAAATAGDALAAAYTTIALLCLAPILQTLVDLLSPQLQDDACLGPRLKGALLNLTNTRPLYFAAKSLARGLTVEGGKAVADGKLLETLTESMPQMLLQSALLAAGLGDPDTIILSLGVSLASIAFACATKDFSLYGWSMWDDRSHGTSVALATGAILYFAADGGSRAAAMYLVTLNNGLTWGAALPWLGGWLAADLLSRAVLMSVAAYNHEYTEEWWAWVTADREDMHTYRTKWYAPDPSPLSALVGVFSAMPLSVNPTERRWLFATSTAAVAATGFHAADDWAADGAGDPPVNKHAAAVLLLCCLGAKAVLFCLAEVVAWQSGVEEEYTGKDLYGFYVFTWTDDTRKSEMARDKAAWAAWFEQWSLNKLRQGSRDQPDPTSPAHAPQGVAFDHALNQAGWCGTALCGGSGGRSDPFAKSIWDWHWSGAYAASKHRLDGLTQWLDKLARLDAFDQHDLDTGSFGCFRSKARAEGDIKRRKQQRGVLKTLSLEGCLSGMPGESCAAFCGMLINTLPQLRKLSLLLQDFGPQASAAIGAALKTNKSLKSIDLGTNNLGAEGGKAIAGALMTNTTLEVLNLATNFGNDEGCDDAGRASVVAALCEMLKVNQTLKEIDLCSNELGEEGGKAIAGALMTNTTLEVLNLATNFGNDEGCDDAGRASVVAALCEMLKANQTLKEINLEFNDFDDVDEAALHSAWGDRDASKIKVLGVGSRLDAAEAYLQELGLDFSGL